MFDNISVEGKDVASCIGGTVGTDVGRVEIDVDAMVG